MGRNQSRRRISRRRRSRRRRSRRISRRISRRSRRRRSKRIIRKVKIFVKCPECGNTVESTPYQKSTNCTKCGHTFYGGSGP